MDGLLIDSERVWLEVESEVMAWLGGEWSTAHQEQLVGGSIDIAVAYMLELTGADADPAEVGGGCWTAWPSGSPPASR